MMTLKKIQFLCSVAFFFTLLPILPAKAYTVKCLPSLSISETYTNNLYFDDDENREHDYITVISPGIMAGIEFKSLGLELSYNPEYSNYNRFDGNNSMRQDAEFIGWAAITKNTRLNLSDNYVRTEDPVTSREDYVYIRRSRYLYHSNNATIEFVTQLSPSNSITLGYNNGLLENDDPDIEDNSSHNPYVNLVYWFSPNLWAVEADVNYLKGLFELETDNFDRYRGDIRFVRRFSRHFDTFIEYSHSTMEYEGENENYNIYNPSAGVRWQISEDSNFTIDVGYFVRDREVSEDDAGLTVDGDLGTTWRFRSGSIGIKGSSGYRESYLDAENLGFSLYYGAECEAEYDFTRHISANALLSFTVDDYSDYENEFGENVDRLDRYTYSGIGVTAQIAKWCSLNLEYSYRFLNSTIVELEYQENRATFTVEIAPPSPFRAVL
jgi:putative beta-barrel porin BBP2